METNLLRAATILTLTGVIVFSVLNSTITPSTLIFSCLAILLQIIYFFPSKFNYPGKITHENKEKIYSTTQVLVLQISLVVSLMAIVLSIRMYTTPLIGFLCALLIILVAQKAIIIFRAVE